MELKVWVEGIQRIVCGVTETTTCQDVVYALAHATGQTGRFTLVERWRTNERLLAPYENPLKILMKWGEYSAEVQLILRRSTPENSKTLNSLGSRLTHGPRSNGIINSASEHITTTNSGQDDTRGITAASNSEFDDVQGCLDRNRDTRKSLTFGGLHGNIMESNAEEFQDTKGQAQSVNQLPVQTPNMVTVAYTQRYVELIKLVNKQRDTINAQQADLTKFDAEILYWETKNREQMHQMDFISQEVSRMESTGRLIEEQLKELAHVEEESEIVRQQEKTLKSEITLLRSKLANCETELLQCKNKIRLVMEELAIEQHNISRETDERQIMERKIISEVEHLQNEVEQAKRSAELASQCAESLKLEVVSLESAIVEKKLQVERLVADMKEANLQSLAVACQDEQVKSLLEGAHKPGSTRKMIGSPRQLETAVPTSKNPHGVWV
ncbi:ras association domain-containing protein 8 isoform X3 [Calliopsis andreniformis]|uniref:ras association domain-containing protein 8 isoform X3 n=1 Tax=Calliopsis andreniformis TaxID=337506 RepID=UPI003FCD4A71